MSTYCISESTMMTEPSFFPLTTSLSALRISKCAGCTSYDVQMYHSSWSGYHVLSHSSSFSSRINMHALRDTLFRGLSIASRRRKRLQMMRSTKQLVYGFCFLFLCEFHSSCLFDMSSTSTITSLP